MATTHLTLEQAAERLGISPEDFKKRLKTDPLFKNLDRGKIRDGTSFRFKESAVEELSRELGAGSDPENPVPTVNDMPAEEPLNLGGDDDVFSLTTDEPKPAKSPPAKSSGGDSDVRLEGGSSKTNKGDKSDKQKRSGKSSDAIATEEIAIDFSGPASSVLKGGEHSGKLSAPRSSTKLTTESGKNLAKPGKGEDSEFELSLDAESGDDFEIKLNTDTSGDDDDDAIGIGEMPKESPGGSRVGRGGESGILSRKPNDTGRSLEKGKPKDKGKSSEDSSDADVDFELTLDSGAGVSSSKLGGVKSGKLATDSDSEFELTLDDGGDGSLEQAAMSEEDDSEASKGDIFETDFEIPPMEESASEAVALESGDTDLEKSDFDVAIDDSDLASTDADTSGSEVVLLEDEDEATPKSKRGKPAKKATDDTDEGDVDLADVEPDEDEEDGSIGGALKGVKGKRRDEDDDDDGPVPAGVYRPVPWGVVPALFLLPAFALTLIGGLMGFELLQTTWGYQQPQKPAAPIVRAVAGQFDMELKD